MCFGMRMCKARWWELVLWALVAVLVMPCGRVDFDV
jgi:hypothetical protein